MAPKSLILTVENADTEKTTQASILASGCIDYTPKVSVIMPVYNVAGYLRQAVDSVLNQTMREIELICVDDGSTDGSVEILREYAAKDSRICVICQQNKFAGVARNAGLAVAKGEFLAFLDSDDFFDTRMLERAYNVARQEQSEVVYFRYCNYDNETGELSAPRGINIPNPAEKGNIYTNSPDYFAEKRYTMCNPMPWNKLISHSLVRREKIRFQGIPASNDVYFSQLLVSCASRITLLYEHLVYYRHNRADSLRNTRDKNPVAFWQAYKLLAHSLRSKGLWEKCKSAYLASLLSSCYWSLMNVTDKKPMVRMLFQQEIWPTFQDDFVKANLSDYMKDLACRLNAPEVIISLTSYPGRIQTLHQVIDTLLNQSMKADKVVLWLAPEQFPNKEADLPESLIEQTKRGLTIDWYHDIRSYKKLIPTLKKYPDALIMTADDDILYPPHLLRDLIREYSAHRNEKVLISPSVSRLYMSNGELFSVGNANLYLDKDSYCHSSVAAPSVFNKLRGGSGTIYPPGCLHPDIFDEEKFMTLAPTSDDIWFYVCALRNGYKVKALPTGRHRLTLIPGSQETALCKVNDAPGIGTFTTHLHNLTSHDSDVLELFRAEHQINSSILFNLAIDKIVEKLSSYRLDIRNIGSAENDVEAVSPELNVSSPAWLCNAQGRGKLISGTAATGSVVLTAKGKGTLRLLFRAADYKYQGQSIPIMADFVKIQINGVTKSQLGIPFNPPHQIDISVEDKEHVEINIKLLPHLYTAHQLRTIIPQLFPGFTYIIENMEQIVSEIIQCSMMARMQYLTEAVSWKYDS